MKKLYALLISLWTLEGILALTIGVCLAGSLMLPTHLAFFSGIDETPLFEWLREAGEPGNTWWIYAMVACFGALGLVTAVCTIDHLLKLRGRRDFMARLFPQLMHMGLLLVMLGHLLTAWQGTREDVLVHEGQKVKLGENTLLVQKVGLGPDTEKKDYYDDWTVEIAFGHADAKLRPVDLKPMKPVRSGDTTLFFRSITLPMKGSAEKPSALIRVVRDPGVLWALSGAMLIVLGGIGFLLTRTQASSSE